MVESDLVFHPVLTCAHCGQENPNGAKFCNACGSALVDAPRAGEERRVVSVCEVARRDGAAVLREVYDGRGAKPRLRLPLA